MSVSSLTTAEEIPNRLDYAEAQRRWYAEWEDRGYFHAEPNENRKPFSIVIPPPNVTGALHLGHALNGTLQDILIRMKRMQGFETLWMPGTDHAGIATQAVVERRILQDEGLSRHDLGREKLVERIWDWKEQYEARILSQLKKLGCSCDWQRTRFTLDPVCASAVRRTFFDLFCKGLIYRGKRLVNWDTFLQTAVSDDEVFHEEVKGHFWHFSYPVIEPKEGEPDHVTIATTRPETMLGDTAVAVHPYPAAAIDKLETALLERLASSPEKEREAIREQVEALRERRQTVLPHLEMLRDMARAGRMLMLPLIEREIPLICDEWAKPEMGSGCVKITPAHDPNDYEVGLRHNLPMINILNGDGTLNENAGQYEKKTVKQARKAVVADLETGNLMVEIEDRLIDLAHSDRSKTPIEPFLADQWFIKMDTLAQSAMDKVNDGEVKIFPTRYSKSYLDWLGEKRDWPVSRQLWWGHQIPIWSQVCNYQEDFDKLIAELKTDPAIESGQASYNVEPNLEREMAMRGDGTVRGAAKVNLPLAVVHVCIAADESQGEAAEIAERIEKLGFVRESDVLDTWFSSALWPHSTLGWPESSEALDYFYPTSTLITSRDILTLWVARMVLAGMNNMNDVPFREVFIHPKILDGYGETMSKSKGNGVDPLDVIAKFGSDALRFGLAHLTTETQDVRMPVQFECPHCGQTMDQTKKNRELPRVDCKHCNEPFSTQWATKDEDKALPRGAAVSERFELARNFCNKLWNASRFVLLNLAGYTSAPVSDDELAIEDRWILSRLATVTREVTDGLEHYRYAEAMRTLYDFAWDEFCSFYVEMVKARLQDESTRPVAQRVLAHTLCTLLRLLHPVIPFITEEVWHLLAAAAPERGLRSPSQASEYIITAAWPEADMGWHDTQIESQFAEFQATLGALREIRSRQNIAPRESIEFCVQCNDVTAELLGPMEVYYKAMANARAVAWGPDVEPPETCAKVSLADMDVYVDLKDFIDIAAEIARNEKQLNLLEGRIVGKEKKLSNASFVERAPDHVVEKERQSLEKMREELASVSATLERLRKLG